MMMLIKLRCVDCMIQVTAAPMHSSDAHSPHPILQVLIAHTRAPRGRGQSSAGERPILQEYKGFSSCWDQILQELLRDVAL